jgi:hypothetical protein
VFNLYDITGGNYHVVRAVTYPDYPKGRIVFDTDVRAVSDSEWATRIAVSGIYDGPTDVVSATDYQIVWTSDGETLFETGGATLVTASGQRVRSQWSSSVKVNQATLRGFPSVGLIVNADYSGFEIRSNAMSYAWEGRVSRVRPVVIDKPKS